MKKLTIFFMIILLVGMIFCSRSKSNADISLLFAGQSNFTTEGELGPRPNVLLDGAPFLGGTKPLVPIMTSSFVAEISGGSVEATNIAVSETSISCWVKGAECFRSFQQVSKTVDALFWWHGERDIFLNTPINEYKASFTSMVSDVRDLFGPIPVFIVEIENQTDQDDSESTFRAMQQELANELTDVYLIRTTDVTSLGDRHAVYAYDIISLRLAKAFLGNKSITGN